MAVLDKLSQRATEGTIETDSSSKLWGKPVLCDSSISPLPPKLIQYYQFLG